MKNFPVPSFFKIRLVALLLGFLLVCFLLGAAKRVLAAYPGECTYQYSSCSSVAWNSYVFTGTSFVYKLPPLFNEETGIWAMQGTVPISGTTTVYYNLSDCVVYNYWWDTGATEWTMKSVVTVTAQSYNISGSDNFGLPSSPPPESGCPAPPTECPDSDNDGLCDACDQAPNDPDVGGDEWLQGYYEYDGKIVATLANDSRDGRNATRTWQSVSKDAPADTPGLCIAGCSGIQDKVFQEGGGKIILFADPQHVGSYACGPPDGQGQCSEAECIFTPDSESPTGQTPLPSQNPDDYVYNTPAPPQTPLPTPTKECSDYRVECSNSCYPNGISSFTCTDNGGARHVHCDCQSGGGTGSDDNPGEWDSHPGEGTGGGGGGGGGDTPPEGCVDDPSTPLNECGNDGGDCVDNPNTTENECAEYGGIGDGKPGDPYSPGEFSIGTRFNTFLTNVRQTGVFALPNSFFNSAPSGGSSTFTFEFGSYGTRTVDLADMSQALLILRTIVLLVFSFVSIRVVIMKR